MQMKWKLHAIIAPKVNQSGILKWLERAPIYVWKYSDCNPEIDKPYSFAAIRDHLFTCGRGAKCYIPTQKLFPNNKLHIYLHIK